MKDVISFFFRCFILDIIFFTLFSWVLLYIDFVGNTHKAAFSFARQHVSFSFQSELISSSSSHHHHHHRHFNSRDCVSNSHQGQILGERRKKKPSSSNVYAIMRNSNEFFFPVSFFFAPHHTHSPCPHTTVAALIHVFRFIL